MHYGRAVCSTAKSLYCKKKTVLALQTFILRQRVRGGFRLSILLIRRCITAIENSDNHIILQRCRNFDRHVSVEGVLLRKTGYCIAFLGIKWYRFVVTIFLYLVYFGIIWYQNYRMYIAFVLREGGRYGLAVKNSDHAVWLYFYWNVNRHVSVERYTWDDINRQVRSPSTIFCSWFCGTYDRAVRR